MAPPSLGGSGASAAPVEAPVETQPEGSASYGAEPGTIAAPGEPTSSSSTPRDTSARANETQTIVHLVRHGEVHNPEGVLYGRLPGFRLSELGRSQAETVARVLGKGHDIVSIVASPLQRAQETAAPLAETLGLPVGIDADIIEAENRFEGRKVGGPGGALRDPQYWPILVNPLRPSWGEPYLQIAHRMIGAVYSTLDTARGHEAVLVSHQLPVYTTRRFLEGRRLWHDPRSRQCSLASVTSLVFEGTTLRDIVYSEPAGASDPSQTGA
ncbi:fructose-2,6-bisphosphatase [Dietzia cinnamea P4]|nr:fructose-2,6-bisphosphatase [Dietzia cinnamea P4]